LLQSNNRFLIKGLFAESIDSLAGAYGIRVAIHGHWKGVSAYWHPDSTLKALEGHPDFGVCADLGHFPKAAWIP